MGEPVDVIVVVLVPTEVTDTVPVAELVREMAAVPDTVPVELWLGLPVVVTLGV